MSKSKEKVKIFNYDLLKSFFSISNTVFAFIGTFIGFLDIDVHIRVDILIILVVITILSYIIYWLISNHLNGLKLKYAESLIEIKKGNIFSTKYKNTDTIRVFAFNEYFDTTVDDKIISKSSLNGQFITKEVDSIDNLNKSIANDQHLSEMKLEVNKKRDKGNTTKYKLGTIYKYSENVFLTALTHFDDKNRAYLSVQDYIRFLITFWDEINTFYAGKTIVVTLLGDGITRLDNNYYSSNQILEMILWTFYLQRIKLKKPAKLVVLLDRNTGRNINYYMIRRIFNGLQE